MSRALLGQGQANALLGAWQSIVGRTPSAPLVGWQESGVPTHLQHGAYGGHQERGMHGWRGHGGGWPQWGGNFVGEGVTPLYQAGQFQGFQGYPPGYSFAQVPVFYGEQPQAPQFTMPYALPPRNLLIDDPPPNRATRIILPLSSGTNILPNMSAQLTARPQTYGMRVERIIIGGNPGDWIINDIKVGNRSQFAQSGDIPGETFAATAIDSFLSFDTIQTAMDFVMVVTFIGTSESGAPFTCSVIGTSAC